MDIVINSATEHVGTYMYNMATLDIAVWFIKQTITGWS